MDLGYLIFRQIEIKTRIINYCSICWKGDDTSKLASCSWLRVSGLGILSRIIDTIGANILPKKNNSFGRFIWRWREVRAGDSSREREYFWLIGMIYCGRIMRLFRCAYHLHNFVRRRRRKTAQDGARRRRDSN
jgi:hypothetical protein